MYPAHQAIQAGNLLDMQIWGHTQTPESDIPGVELTICLNKPTHSDALGSVRTSTPEGLGQWWVGAKGTQTSGFSEEPQELALESAEEFNRQDLPGQRTCTTGPLSLPEFRVPSDTVW